MKIAEFMKDLYDFADPSDRGKTCDNLKAGDPGKELRKVAVSMFAAPSVLRSAAEWGAELLIVHEPSFYDHWDDLTDLEHFEEPQKTLIRAKLRLIEETNLTIYRFHDHPHTMVPDMISKGLVRFWGLEGSWEKGPSYGVNRFTLKTPVPAEDLAKSLEKNLKLAHIRICGERQVLCRKLSLCLGTPGHLESEFAENDAVLTGEICEWRNGEFFRDWNGLFPERKKAVLVLGHIGSERDGMRYLAEIIRERYPSLESRYFECGETYA